MLYLYCDISKSAKMVSNKKAIKIKKIKVLWVEETEKPNEVK